MSASASPTSGGVRRLTVTDIARMYADGERIAMLTAYDYPQARLLDEAGIPMLLVGDSLGRAMLGYENELSVSMSDMLHHAAAVTRGAKHALVVGDMPFLSYASPEDALRNAGAFIHDAGVQAVKVEGGVRSARVIEALVKAGIPVMGHIGLTPQSANQIGKFRVQGKSAEQARALLHDALAVQEAGAFSVVLELVPEQLAAAITERLRIPTIGIGAGPAAAARSRSSPTSSGSTPGSRSTPSSTRTSTRRSSRRSGPTRRTSPPALPGARADGPHGRRGARRGPRPIGARRVLCAVAGRARRRDPARPRPLGPSPPLPSGRDNRPPPDRFRGCLARCPRGPQGRR